MNFLFFSLMFFLQIESNLVFLPENAVHVQTIEDDCTGDGEKETVCVYDIDGRFGTEKYQGTIVAIFKKVGSEFREMYKCRLSADVKIKLVKVFDEIPPLIEVQWFRSKGGGYIYICYEENLYRFKEVLNLESGGLNNQDLDGDGKDEVFSFDFLPVDCDNQKKTIFAGTLTFYSCRNGNILSEPLKPYYMRPGITYFASETANSANFFSVFPDYSNKREFRDKDDLSFKFLLSQDEGFLRIVLHIKDNAIYEDESHILQGDYLVILLDTDLSGDFCRQTLNDDDIVINIVPGVGKSENPVVLNGNNLSAFSKDLTGRIYGNVERKIGGYSVDVKIPVQREMMKRTVFGLGIEVYDRDGKNSYSPSRKLCWPPNLKESDPTTWGNLYLFSN